MTTIAVAGKGGTGKSTISAIIVRWLSDHISKSILVVDADSNVNLNDLLGVELKATVGGIREEMKQKVSKLPGGMTKQQFLEYKIQSSVIETPDFDLIAMGRPEGPGCYCYANSILRDVLKTLAGNYEYIVIDNEAGMEHLSRRTTRAADILFLVSDHSLKGVTSGARIAELAQELKLDVKEMGFVINRVPGEMDPLIRQKVEEKGLAILGSIPEDAQIGRFDLEGKSLLDFPEDNSVTIAVREMVEKILVN